VLFAAAIRVKSWDADSVSEGGARVRVMSMTPASPKPPSLLAGEEGEWNLRVVRTDFSDDAAWADAIARVSAQYGGEGDEPISFEVTPIDDPRYANLTPAQLAALAPQDADWPMLAAADALTMASPQRHMLLVNLDEDSLGPTARATPAHIVEMAINLWLGNMDWEEFVGDPEHGTYSADEVHEAWNVPEPE